MKATLGASYTDPRRASFYPSNPVKTQTQFGDLNGDGISEDFTRLAGPSGGDRVDVAEPRLALKPRIWSICYDRLFIGVEEDFAGGDPQ